MPQDKVLCRAKKVFPTKQYGFMERADGVPGDIFFHKNNMLSGKLLRTGEYALAVIVPSPDPKKQPFAIHIEVL